MLLTNIHRVLIPYATAALSAFRTIFCLLLKNPCAYSVQLKKWRRPGKNLPRLTANEWRVRNQTQTVISRAWAWTTSRAVSEELAIAQSWIVSGGKTSKYISSHLSNPCNGRTYFSVFTRTLWGFERVWWGKCFLNCQHPSECQRSLKGEKKKKKKKPDCWHWPLGQNYFSWITWKLVRYAVSLDPLQPVHCVGPGHPGGGPGNHFSILAWRIPWTEEPGRLLSMGSQRVGHDQSDLAHMHRSRAQGSSFAPVPQVVWCGNSWAPLKNADFRSPALRPWWSIYT